MRKGSFVIAALLVLLISMIILSHVGQLVRMRTNGFSFPQKEIVINYAPSSGGGIP
ncbi:hypothetical protein Theth_0010 [Pseudothermotoga thermarum DSM 5069]|uniref:Uncharacterized protein n=1 Tax=Pseudothermotoga thermarum DSM 5069 TaxID=688269 RepID=F7YTE0_9THEM|nr:hypothetical protein Theth_0010 [Pseudothermotoga thermarum DSM 5069]